MKASLVKADLFGADLSNADLSFANLTRSALRGVSLAGANLNNANLNDADFRGGTILTAGGESVGRDVTDLSDCMLDFATLMPGEDDGRGSPRQQLDRRQLEGCKPGGSQPRTNGFLRRKP